MLLRKIGEDSNVLDHQPPCLACGQPLEGFWFARGPGQASAVTTRLGSSLVCEPAEAVLPAYSVCCVCWSHVTAAIVLERRKLARLDVERVEPFFQPAEAPGT